MLYPLDEALFLTLCAVLCGADGWLSVALFGEQKLDFLRGYQKKIAEKTIVNAIFHSCRNDDI